MSNFDGSTATAEPNIGQLHEGPAMQENVADSDTELEQEPSIGAKKVSSQDWPLYVLAAVIVLGFFGLTVTMVAHEIPDKSKEIAYMLLGGLMSGFSMVLSYFFGSSAGSAQKTTQIGKLINSGKV